MSKIKVLHAESQVLAAEGLKKVLSDHQISHKIYNVDKSEFIEPGIVAYEPNICIIDYAQSENFSIEDIENIIKKHPQIKILIISDDSSIIRVKKVLELGVHGFVTRISNTEEILLAIQKVLEGEKYFCSAIIDILVNKRDTHLELNTINKSLTLREQQVVKNIALGKTNKQISFLLGISHHTVHAHRKNAMKKLTIKTSAELALYAVDTGLIKLAY